MPRIDPQHPLDATEQRPTPGDSLAAPPSFILLQALNAIHLVCGNAGLFEELAKRRRRESDSEIAMLNDLSKAASSRINERIRTGKPTKAIEEYQRIRKQADKAPRQREPAAQTSLLRGLIRTGDDWCKTAEQALRDGGAERLDRALSPGTRKQSTRLGAKIDEMRSVLLGLEFGLSDQSVVIDQQVKQLAALGRFFDAQTTRLGVVLKQPAAKAGGADDDDVHYKPGKWFGKTLTPRLRKAAAPNRKTTRVRSRTIGGVVCYHVEDARRWWGSKVPNDK